MAAGRLRTGGRLALGVGLEVIRDRYVKIHPVDMRIIDGVFGMEGGFVLDFSNRTFADFFREELDIDIYDAHWAAQGGSKAKRLRYYLRQADRQTTLDALNALWEYREASTITADHPELDASVRAACFRVIERLGGKPPEPAVPTAAHREPSAAAAVTSAWKMETVSAARTIINASFPGCCLAFDGPLLNHNW